MPERNLGARVDPDRLLNELARRGITAAELAERAGVRPATLSNALRGERVTAPTLKKIVEALLSFPVVEGVDLLLPEEVR